MARTVIDQVKLLHGTYKAPRLPTQAGSEPTGTANPNVLPAKLRARRRAPSFGALRVHLLCFHPQHPAETAIGPCAARWPYPRGDGAPRTGGTAAENQVVAEGVARAVAVPEPQAGPGQQAVEPAAAVRHTGGWQGGGPGWRDAEPDPEPSGLGPRPLWIG